MKNSKQTSKRAATAASAVLRDGRTSAKSKTAAGSALAQRASKKLNRIRRARHRCQHLCRVYVTCGI